MLLIAGAALEPPLLQVAGRVRPCPIWAATHCNPADAPTRGLEALRAIWVETRSNPADAPTRYCIGASFTAFGLGCASRPSAAGRRLRRLPSTKKGI